MAIAPFLAMTAAEIRANPDVCSPIGWMACHFSPYGTGLGNLPEQLPEGSLLILNDRTPWWSHDPDQILRQVNERIASLSCRGLLLDFQMPRVAEVTDLARLLSTQLDCPVGVTETYAEGLDCPVFLPPVPLNQTAEEYLQRWQGREIWLELAPEGASVTVTTEGSRTTPLLPQDFPEAGFIDASMHLHYKTRVAEDHAFFSLWRTKEDLKTLLAEAEHYGVTTAVGLWQEMHAL